MKYGIKLVEMIAEESLYIRIRTSIEELPSVVGIGYGKICEYLAEMGEEPCGIPLNQAQGVLLDVPCSGLGVLNRRADSRWRKNPDSISDLLLLQSRLLQKAASMVLPGGRLVYSTCTLNREENDELVRQFMNNNPDFVLEGFTQDISFFPIDNKDKESAAGGMLTMLPGKYETDGMFYAKMRRKLSF